MKITYRFDPQEKALLRGEVGEKDVILGKQKEGYEEKIVLKLEELNMNYFYFNKETKSYGWQDSWKKEDGSFRLIKLNGKYNGKEFTKVIFVPAS